MLTRPALMTFAFSVTVETTPMVRLQLYTYTKHLNLNIYTGSTYLFI